MTEATWGDESTNPAVDWSMSAALENVVRSGKEVAEVANLADVVREWQRLDPEHRRDAVLTPERPIVIDGASHGRITSDGIAALAARLPA